MKNQLVVFSWLVLLCLSGVGSEVKEAVKVGIILDMNSNVGEIAKSFIQMAISDFYDLNRNGQTNLNLLWRDSKADVILALSAALDLIENEQVHAIIGPQYSSEAKILANLGKKVKIPIISFSATSPSISGGGNQFLIRTVRDDSSQVNATVNIVQNYGWQDIVLIHEDTEYGNGLVPSLLDAFEGINARISYRIRIHRFSNETEISKQLEKLKEMRKYVFLVHTKSSVGSKLFLAAEKMGMMKVGYAWLVTQSLSKLLDPVSPEVQEKNAMFGVLGVRPFVPETNKIANFRSKWKDNITMYKLDKQGNELNLYGSLAYDTIWALALAVERAGIHRPRYSKSNGDVSKIDVVHLGVSDSGTKILNSIKNVSFNGLSGEFHLQNGEPAPSKFEVFNVVCGEERIIGFWTAEGGLSSSENFTNAKLSSKNRLKKPIWPGDVDYEQPRKLRVGVPYIPGAFNKFVRVEWDPNNNSKVSGVAIDIFCSSVDLLPFPLPYEFIPYVDASKRSNGTTDDMCSNSVADFWVFTQEHEEHVHHFQNSALNLATDFSKTEDKGDFRWCLTL